MSESVVVMKRLWTVTFDGVAVGVFSSEEEAYRFVNKATDRLYVNLYDKFKIVEHWMNDPDWGYIEIYAKFMEKTGRN